MLAIGACRKAPEAPVTQSKLQQAMQGLNEQEPCDRLIPMEWPSSWPVPTGAKVGREFKVFFYPLGKSSGHVHATVPLGEATFDADTGKPSACQRLPGDLRELPGERWGQTVAAITMQEFQRRTAVLYTVTEEVSGLYAARPPLDDKQRQKLADYRKLFLDLAEPVLLEYYRALNPDFWKWLADNGAAALPAPKP